jgi:hypothetical protein
MRWRFGRDDIETISPPAPPSRERDADAIVTVAKLFTGLGGDIPDTEMRALEEWINQR